MNRAPGSLFTLDADGYVRNTYLLKLTNKLADAGEVEYTVEVDGLEGAEVSSPALTVGPEQSRTIPLIIRLPASAVRARSVPLTVRIASPSGSLLLPTNFATGASLGGD